MQISELAQRLHTTTNALKVWLRRNGLQVTDELTDNNLKLICLGYSVANSNRKIETVQAAREILQELERQEKQQDIATPAPIETPAETQQQHITTQPETRQNAKGGRVFLFFVFVSMLVWQMFHTALLEHSVSPFSGMLGFVLSAVFAFGVQFTGLLLTIYKADKRFLMMYLVIDLVINVLVYFPFEGLAKLMLSVVAALAIYSYSELFTSK